MGRPQTSDPAIAGTRQTADRSDPGRSDLPSGGARRWKFAAPVGVSREDIAERIADRLAWAIFGKPRHDRFAIYAGNELIAGWPDSRFVPYGLPANPYGGSSETIATDSANHPNADAPTDRHSLSEPMHSSRQAPRRSRPLQMAAQSFEPVISADRREMMTRAADK